MISDKKQAEELCIGDGCNFFMDTWDQGGDIYICTRVSGYKPVKPGQKCLLKPQPNEAQQKADRS